jgi:hypothetical protein
MRKTFSGFHEWEQEDPHASQNFQNATFNKKHNQHLHEVLLSPPQVYQQT